MKLSKLKIAWIFLIVSFVIFLIFSINITGENYTFKDRSYAISFAIFFLYIITFFVVISIVTLCKTIGKSERIMYSDSKNSSSIIKFRNLLIFFILALITLLVIELIAENQLIKQPFWVFPLVFILPCAVIIGGIIFCLYKMHILSKK